MLYYFLILLFFFLPYLYFLYLFLFKKNSFITFFQFIFFKHNISYFSEGKNFFIDKIMFLPHPFLNWSLNPNFKNVYGKLAHTKEGFRKTLDVDSIIKYLDSHKKTFKIVCIGGSTTQCSDIDNFDETWPALIDSNLKKNSVDATVINFGVGAWSTIQSHLRCLTWFSKIKPDLVIFYHAKNDLTPLVNGNLNENFIYPDYQNVVTQFNERYITNFSKIFLFIPIILFIYYFYHFKKYSKGLLGIYKPIAMQNELGMNRLDDNFINSILLRHESIVNLCKQINSNVLYIPEIVIDGIYRDVLIKNLFPKLNKNLIKYDNLEWFDIDKVMPKTKDIFWDKMHFTIKGNRIFADIISKKILDKYFSE